MEAVYIQVVRNTLNTPVYVHETGSANIYVSILWNLRTDRVFRLQGIFYRLQGTFNAHLAIQCTP